MPATRCMHAVSPLRHRVFHIHESTLWDCPLAEHVPTLEGKHGLNKTRLAVTRTVSQLQAEFH